MIDASRDPLFVSRDEIADQAALIIDYAVMMSDFARVGDDHGIAYTYRKTLAHMRMAAAALQLIIDAHNAVPAEGDETPPIEEGAETPPSNAMDQAEAAA